MHIKGVLSEQCLWTYFSRRSEVPVLHVHDIEGTVLAPIQAALEDLSVPNKFADAFPATTRVMKRQVDLDRLAFSLQGRFTQRLRGFPCRTRQRMGVSRTSMNLWVHNLNLKVYSNKAVSS